MKATKILAILLSLTLLLTACGSTLSDSKQSDIPYLPDAPTVNTKSPLDSDVTQILLGQDSITVNGTAVGSDVTAAVYTANDIVYYESGMDFTYGEGSEEDAHSPEEAAAHTVVHITKPGTYSLSGKLSLGQVAVDLGDDAKDNPEAVVTLILNGVDITCEVAPAVIFYNVYECGSDDAESATKDVDTSAAGANVVIADGTVNNVTGSYVARIYKPGSVVLSEDGTEVEDSKKLHKYDGAFYSKRTMNLFGGAENTGVLNILAENEGLDSELHLTINGGNIHITSGNDGINTNEDGISVTTINGGTLNILVTGETSEGDGIDSNGWLVINGGTVTAQACAISADSGIDSDMGIHINGGTVVATGSMLDSIETGGQNYAVFNFSEKQAGGETITMWDAQENCILEATPENAYSILIFSSPDLEAGTYTLWSDHDQLAGTVGGMMGGFGGGRGPGGRGPGRGNRPSGDGQEEFTPPEDFERPEGDFEDFEWPDGNFEDFEWSENAAPPEGFEPPQGGNRGSFGFSTGEASTDFEISDGGNNFSVTYA